MSIIKSLRAVFLPEPVVIVKHEKILDPRGFSRADMEFIRRHTKAVHYKAGVTIEDIAYAQGQADLIQFIATKVVGRRMTDGTT